MYYIINDLGDYWNIHDGWTEFLECATLYDEPNHCLEDEVFLKMNNAKYVKCD